MTATLQKSAKISALAIDGPAGSGKSTVAKTVAQQTGFTYIDTGAMYRALTWKAMRRQMDLTDETALTELAKQTEWRFESSSAKLFLDGRDVSAEIRSPEVTNNIKFAARVPAVREHLVRLQRALAAEKKSVMEGRDITTVVLPDAAWRVFLTASPEVRARRRVADFRERGFGADYAEILRDVIERDQSDFSIGPLKRALELAQQGEIFLVDTSAMSAEEVIAAIIVLLGK